MQNKTISKLFLLALLVTKSHAFTFHVECEKQVLCHHVSNISPSKRKRLNVSHSNILSQLQYKIGKYYHLDDISVNKHLAIELFAGQIMDMCNAFARLGKKMEVSVTITRDEESRGYEALLIALKELENAGMLVCSILE